MLTCLIHRKTDMYAKSCLALLFLVFELCCVVVQGENHGWWPPRPKFTEKAKMARYLCHTLDWGVVSGISPDFGYVPFGTIQSFADGPYMKSTGVPYFYIADISDTHKNIAFNNSVSLAMTETEGLYCRWKNLDPEEPTCARLTLTGKMVQVTEPHEQKFAKVTLFSRHPAMKNWPSSHGWNFFKLQIEGICLLDYYGGASHIPVKEYFAVNPYNSTTAEGLQS